MNKIAFAVALVCGLLASAPATQGGGKGKKPPAAGTVFHLSPTSPKYVTCDIEFRDPADRLWPHFFYGKPAAAGTLTFDPVSPQASFRLLCDQMVQKNGDQSRRVLGDLLQDGKVPAVTFTIKSMGKFEKTDGGKNAVEFVMCEGVLDLDGKQTAVKAKTTLKFSYPKNGEMPDTVALTCQFSVKGGDMGLRQADQVIDVRVSTTAYLQTEAGKE